MVTDKFIIKEINNIKYLDSSKKISSTESNVNNCFHENKISNISIIDEDELIDIFGNNSSNVILFLDCRSFPDFYTKHIKNSVHLNCRDKIIKKRLQTKKLSVRDLIGSEEMKQLFDEIVYNGSNNISNCELLSTMKLAKR